MMNFVGNFVGRVVRLSTLDSRHDPGPSTSITHHVPVHLTNCDAMLPNTSESKEARENQRRDAPPPAQRGRRKTARSTVGDRMIDIDIFYIRAGSTRSEPAPKCQMPDARCPISRFPIPNPPNRRCECPLSAHYIQNFSTFHAMRTFKNHWQH